MHRQVVIRLISLGVTGGVNSDGRALLSCSSCVFLLPHLVTPRIPLKDSLSYQIHQYGYIFQSWHSEKRKKNNYVLFLAVLCAQFSVPVPVHEFPLVE